MGLVVRWYFFPSNISADVSRGFSGEGQVLSIWQV